MKTKPRKPAKPKPVTAQARRLARRVVTIWINEDHDFGPDIYNPDDFAYDEFTERDVKRLIQMIADAITKAVK